MQPHDSNLHRRPDTTSVSIRSQQRIISAGAHLPRIEQPQRVNRAFNSLHQLNRPGAELLDEELALPNAYAVFPCAYPPFRQPQETSAEGGKGQNHVQVPSSAIARSTMRCTTALTTSSSASVVNSNSA
jgi:hypothetical protein